MAKVEGTAVNVGDFVCFKRGVEQGGRIVKIVGESLTIAVYDSDSGDERNVIEQASRCWIE